jgi:Uma2 family endonuclease
MATARRVHHTYADYLAIEHSSPVKHEYLDGEIFAMAGGTPEHAALAAQMIALVQARLPAGCRAFSSDLKVRIDETGLTTYPDISVVCGPLERARDDANAITNPIWIVEVTSPSTEEYDRGEKLSHYQRVPSLQAMLVVSHKAPRLSLFTRDASGWSAREFAAGELFALPSPRLEIPVDQIYEALRGL